MTKSIMMTVIDATHMIFMLKLSNEYFSKGGVPFTTHITCDAIVHVNF